VIFDLQGLAFLVTGGARGIGAATAELAARNGANVMIADILDDAGEQTVARIADTGGSAAYHHCDLTDPGQIGALMEATANRFGGLDVLNNNAGITDALAAGPDGDLSIEGLSVEVWDRVMAVNLRAPFLCVQAALPFLKRSAAASVINAASIASWVARPFTLAYGPSKGGVAQLTKTLALALAPYRIRVNAYGPGVVETEQASALFALADDPEAKRRAVLDNYLVTDLGRPVDVANVVCFLASPQSAFVNGVVWPVDGGFTAWKATLAEL